MTDMTGTETAHRRCHFCHLVIFQSRDQRSTKPKRGVNNVSDAIAEELDAIDYNIDIAIKMFDRRLSGIEERLLGIENAIVQLSSALVKVAEAIQAKAEKGSPGEGEGPSGTVPGFVVMK
jgi:hypothetical protein